MGKLQGSDTDVGASPELNIIHYRFMWDLSGALKQTDRMPFMVSRHRRLMNRDFSVETSGYATWFTAGGAIRIGHYDVIDDVITRKL